MENKMNRRSFAKQTSLAVGGLLASGSVGTNRSHSGEENPTDQRLMLLGLNALARANEMDYFRGPGKKG